MEAVMSGSKYPAIPPLSPGGSVQQQLAQVTTELQQKANRNAEELFTSIVLRAPSGAHFRVTVSDAGALVVAPFT
jgi:hypothetical protein